MPKDMRLDAALPVASVRDRLAFVGAVVAPQVAKGPIIRRPRVVRLAERLDLDARAVRRMARLRDAYGGDLLLVPLPGRLHAVALSPEAVRRVLDGTPDPFTPASLEKRWALGHFEPEVSLVSKGAARTERRRFQDQVLEPERPVHSLAGPMLAAATEEAARLAERPGRLDWARFAAAFYPTTRRVVLGDGARDDSGLQDLLGRLRRRGNWVVLPRRRDLLADLRGRIAAHLGRAEAGSLAARIRQAPQGPETAVPDQVAHHLFAFDAAGLAAFRALALLAAHPDVLAAAREEAAWGDRARLPLLRAAFLESLRLWPTTPMILREAARDVDWDGARLPRGANVLIFTPFFHRDPALPSADRFAPGLWTGEEDGKGAALVPFSAGPGRCPAAELVPMVAAAFLAALVAARTPRLAEPGRVRADRPLPGTLEPYSLAFDMG